MSWNHRILRHEDGTYQLHEVYYDADGEPNAWVPAPSVFLAMEEEGAQSIVAELKRALASVRKLPPLRIEGDRLLPLAEEQEPGGGS